MGEIKLKDSVTGNKEARSENHRFPSLIKYFLGLIGLLLIIGSAYFFGFKSNSAEVVLKRYLNSNTWQERLKYVKKPEVVKSLMSDFYNGQDLTGGKPFLRLEIEDGANVREMKIGDWVNIRAVFDEGKNAFGVTVQDDAWYSLQLTKSGFKIDWEASVNYNPMTFKAMEAQQPTKVQKFRVFAELADYYNYEFRDSKYFLYSIRLHEPDSYEQIFGYIKKNSEDGLKLYEILKDGKKHPVILKIRYPQYSAGSGQVIIDEFVQEYFNEP